MLLQKDNEQENSTYKENQGPTQHTPNTQQISPKKKCTLTFKKDTQDCYKKYSPPKTVADSIKFEEDSSNSTFELPSEFIAEHNSDESVQFESPKLKTVDIQKNSSLEISEHGEIVNIDVVKMKHTENKDVFNNLTLSPVETEKCAFKFSPIDKETLQQSNLDIDFQSFKNQYLNEVDRDFKCEFAHKHERNECRTTKLQSAIDFAIEASIKKDARKKLKRKKHQDGVADKEQEVTLVYKDVDEKNIKLICENKNNTLDLTVDTPKIKRKHKKHKKNRGNIQVKIKWREERLKLKITQSKKNKKKTKDNTKENTLKQYVLTYQKEKSEVVSLVKPDRDVTPKKRKYVKTEKSPDNLVQTSIHSFFKTKPNI